MAQTIGDGNVRVDVDVRKPGFLASLFNHPAGFWFIFWGEFAERCSYYGMRAILATYMADQLGLGRDNAGTYMSFFIAACYFLPLIGGYLADNFFGKYWTIVGFSVPYILGHVILGVENTLCLFIALSLLAMGSGVIKPNISTLMGLTYDQQRPGQEQLRTTAFSMFYMAINIGAFISQFALPIIRNEYGYWVAFLFPAALMVLAFAIFTVGKPFYAREVIVRTPSTPEEWSLKVAILIRIGGLFLLVMFFWAIFDQSASTWIFFADTYMDANLFALTVDAEQIQALNPLLIVCFLPLITILWVYLDQTGVRVRATDKMAVGFLLTAVCMGVMALAAWRAGPPEQEVRLVLKDGAATLSQCRVTFPEGVVDVRDARATVKRGRITLEAGQLVTPAGMVSLDRAAQVFPEHRIEVKDGHVAIKHGKVFIKDGTVRVERIGEESTALAGEATVGAGKVSNTSGSLKTQETGTVMGPADATVLQADEYTTSANKVSLWWQALAYFLLTIAEILISVTGLELAFVAAPKTMKSFVTALWLLTVGLANLFINAPLTARYTQFSPANYFAMLTAILVVVMVAFMFIAKRFNQMSALAADQPMIPPPTSYPTSDAEPDSRIKEIDPRISKGPPG